MTEEILPTINPEMKMGMDLPRAYRDMRKEASGMLPDETLKTIAPRRKEVQEGQREKV